MKGFLVFFSVYISQDSTFRYELHREVTEEGIPRNS